MVREVVEVATIIISNRHLNIVTVIRTLYTLFWQIPDYIYVKLTYTGIICF